LETASIDIDVHEWMVSSIHCEKLYYE